MAHPYVAESGLFMTYRYYMAVRRWERSTSEHSQPKPCVYYLVVKRPDGGVMFCKRVMALSEIDMIDYYSAIINDELFEGVSMNDSLWDDYSNARVYLEEDGGRILELKPYNKPVHDLVEKAQSQAMRMYDGLNV
ncbi:hypothetical protein [Conchiformibius steedae]|uniref:Uncharacterized protein n=1 Tax=Conchiformibius steedae TaxID=153493 RepID=A0A3P2A8A8_9NEIS|nr:hypothetical protein [Conchiformibius steedae]RRD91732.1 hypothetical protein EII21_01535 [Conchiformibius steedae]